jgi:hypothetical protein
MFGIGVDPIVAAQHRIEGRAPLLAAEADQPDAIDLQDLGGRRHDPVQSLRSACLTA